MKIIMEVLFRYIVFDEFGEPIRRFRTKHEAEAYVEERPNHVIKELLKPKTDDLVYDCY